MSRSLEVPYQYIYMEEICFEIKMMLKCLPTHAEIHSVLNNMYMASSSAPKVIIESDLLSLVCAVFDD